MRKAADVTLVLAAHGSRHEPAANDLLRGWAAELSRRMVESGEFDEVVAAFHQGTPTFADVLDTLSARRVVVVPVMTSEGYYCDEFLPAELAMNSRFGDVHLTITRPVGVHAKIIDLAETRALELAARICVRPEAASLAVVGHGTPKNPRSRAATEQLVDDLRRRGTFAEVQAFFLDESPGVEEILNRCAGATILLLPFLISGGPHAARDIPRRLGIETRPELPPPICGHMGGRMVICDAALGTDARMIDVIVALARDGRDARITLNKEAARTTQGERVLRLGTRGSRLALWQANHVAGLLRAGGAVVEIVTLTTCGDRLLDVPIRDLPGDDAFTGDLVRALRDGRIDLAVHALKDLPVTQGLDDAQDENLKIAAVLPRGSVGESLVTFVEPAPSRSRLGPSDRGCSSLLPGAVVGTSSPRRAAQLLAVRPDLVVRPIRGAVDDRVRQVQAGRFDAAILATAGLERLGLLDAACESLPLDTFLPAPGQGALVVQIRADDADALRRVEQLDDHAARAAVTAELEFLRPFEFSESRIAAAHAPVSHALKNQPPGYRHGTFHSLDERATAFIELRARLLSPDGSRVVDVVTAGDDPRALGRHAVEQALARFDLPVEVAS